MRDDPHPAQKAGGPRRHVPDDESPIGAQIDLVLDRADGVVNACEMKYSRDAYMIEIQDGFLLSFHVLRWQLHQGSRARRGLLEEFFRRNDEVEEPIGLHARGKSKERRHVEREVQNAVALHDVALVEDYRLADPTAELPHELVERRMPFEGR